VQNEAAVASLGVLVEMVDAVGVEKRSATLDAMDDVALLEEELGEVRAILSGDARDEGYLCFWHAAAV
jgi:hypothetical protein